MLTNETLKFKCENIFYTENRLISGNVMDLLSILPIEFKSLLQ